MNDLINLLKFINSLFYRVSLIIQIYAGVQ